MGTSFSFLGMCGKPPTKVVIQGRHFSHNQAWIKGKRKGLDFAIAVVWREPQNHFCLTTIFQHSSKSKHLCYPNLPSAMRPAPHSDEIPPPVFTGLSDEREKMFHPKMQHFSVEDFKA